MAVAGSWRIYGSVTGLTAGTVTVDQTISAPTTAVGDQSTTSFPVANTTVTPPAAATAALIIPPSANTNVITLKGVAGDTGIPISKTKPTLLTFAAGSTFVIQVATGATILTIQYM